MTELKPCPACGSKMATPVLEYDVKFPQLGYVRCREITCGLKTGLFSDGGRHAVEIWNSLPRTDEARGVGKWISVEERLPEKYKPVLVSYVGYNTNSLLSDMVAYRDGDGDWCWWDGEFPSGEICKVKVTHWIPLPAPPKEG